jgi:hypothetical protein
VSEPRFIVVAATEMPSIAYKIMLCKAFGVYPKDEDVEFLVNPDIVLDQSRVYLFDRSAIRALPEKDPMVLFDNGDLDPHFKVASR